MLACKVRILDINMSDMRWGSAATKSCQRRNIIFIIITHYLTPPILTPRFMNAENFEKTMQMTHADNTLILLISTFIPHPHPHHTTHSMTNILKHSTNIPQPIARLLPQQQILNLAQRPRLAIIDKVIPRTRVTVKHSRRFRHLSPIFLPTALTLERVVCVTRSVVAVLEQLAERVEREMAFNVFRAVDDARRQRLFVRLALEDFLFDGASGDEAVHETILLLSVTPHTREGLLIGSGVPIRVEEDEAVRADEVETAATSFGGEEEDEFGAFGVVEFVDELLALAHVHGAIETETAVAA